jgi:two-component system, cell cycle sensor histidine kinase and response regulator CckA
LYDHFIGCCFIRPYFRLGLSVVHGVVTNHGGSIRLYSELGKGTVFHLYFPATQAAAESQPKPADRISRERTELTLYVDDEEQSKKMAIQQLIQKPNTLEQLQQTLDKVFVRRIEPAEEAVS